MVTYFFCPTGRNRTFSLQPGALRIKEGVNIIQGAIPLRSGCVYADVNLPHKYNKNIVNTKLFLIFGKNKIYANIKNSKNSKGKKEIGKSCAARANDTYSQKNCGLGR